MGAFITGLIGRAEQQRDKEEAREFQEAKQERDRKRQMVDYAGQMAIQKGDYASLPAIFGELDELGPPPGTPKGMKDPYKQLGAKIGSMLGLKKKQQQQQQQNRQADQAYTQVTGAPPPGMPTTPPMPPPSGPVAAAQGQPPQTPQAVGRMGPTPQGAPQMAPGTTPPIPQSRMQGVVQALESGERRGQMRKEEQAETEFQLGRRHGDVEAGDVRSRKLADQQAYYDAFIKQGMSKDRAEQLSEEIAFGKVAAPAKRAVKEIPNIEGTPYGYPGKSGTLEIDMNDPNAKPVFRPTTPKTGADDVAKWAKIYMAKDPRLTPEQATQRAAAMLIETKQLLPEQRLQATYDAVRSIQGETGFAQLPTHVRQGGRTVTPPIPPSRMAPGPAGAGQPPASGSAGGVREIPYGDFKPEIKGTERTRKTNAEVIMQRGGSAIATINQMSREHPDWFGPVAGRVQDLEKRFGNADPRIGQLKGAMESLIGFLPSLHSFRSKGILDSWKETLDNPLKNPQLTIATMREVMKAAEELRNDILKRNAGPMSAEEEESKAASGGGGTSGPTKEEQDYMKKHGIQ